MTTSQRRPRAAWRRERRATIDDVAARAGVGKSTVSRVLNDGEVSSATRTRVLAAIDDLAYRPRSAARRLASGRTGVVGMVIPCFTHPSAVERLRGVFEALSEDVHDLVVLNVASPAQRDELLGAGASLDRFDGLLVVSLAPRDHEVEGFARAGLPVVLLDADHPRLPRLVVDDVRGGELAVRHLLELGHERIAFVGDRPDPGFGFVSSHRRRQGYERALAAAGLRPQRGLRREAHHGRASAHRLTRELLALETPPTAVFAASDTQALGVLEAATCEGVSVPDELSVVGFDDLEVSAYVGLTTVGQALGDSGRRATERLLAAIAGEREPDAEQLPLELLVRRTTAPPAS